MFCGEVEPRSRMQRLSWLAMIRVNSPSPLECRVGRGCEATCGVAEALAEPRNNRKKLCPTDAMDGDDRSCKTLASTSSPRAVNAMSDWNRAHPPTRQRL